MERNMKRARVAVSVQERRNPLGEDIDQVPDRLLLQIQHESSGKRSAAYDLPQALVVMCLDVDEGPSGTFHVWGRNSHGATVLIQVHDYCPYLYVPAPQRAVPSAAAARSGDGGGDDGGGGGGGSGGAGSGADGWSDRELDALRQHWNSRLPSECRITSLTPVTARPIMYFRPAAPAGSAYLRATLRPGGAAKRAGTALTGLMSGREAGLAESLLGMRFVDRTVHEAEVKLLLRFLCDTALSGGAWCYLPPAAAPEHAGGGGGGAGAAGSCGGLGYSVVPPGSRVSTCDIEVVAPWRSLQSLTPDATQLADPEWCPEIVRLAGGCRGDSGAAAPPALPPSLAAAFLAARHGAIAPLTVMTVDVLAVPHDTTNRTPVTAKDDPVVCVACDVRTYSTAAAAAPATTGTAGSLASTGAAAGGGGGLQAPSRTVFLVTGGALTRGSVPQPASLRGARLRCFATEADLLAAWREWFLCTDPDIVATFQVRDTLGALRDRFERLRLQGGGLLLSRLRPPPGAGGPGGGGGGASAAAAAPLTVKSVVMYSAAWVKSQSRMASTSNQVVSRAGSRNRIAVPVESRPGTRGPVLFVSSVKHHGATARPFAFLPYRRRRFGRTYTAGWWWMCCDRCLPGSLLPPSVWWTAASRCWGRRWRYWDPSTRRVSRRRRLARRRRRRRGSEGTPPAARLASYLLRRVEVVVRLMGRLATLPEAFEMARVTGLTIPQVMYNAQMIRTWSLLHRNAHRQNYIIGGRQEAGNLTESPFLMHPIENNTAGLYRSPVATLDFASLYPSLYRAHNLCYTTLVHPDDVEAVGRGAVAFTPTGHAFVKPEVRPGILPSILAALMTARAATRAALKTTSPADPAAAAVLESRQKALKLTANALYGFTGAGASPLQCVPLADSCLALGAAACRGAIATIGAALAAGRGGPLGPGPEAEGGRVIYAQTDSVFVHFPRATPAEAVRLGKKAAALVTSSLPAPMCLQYERVMSPFLLLHVNRYAGRAVEGEEAAEAPEVQGKLLVKGIRSMWRQSAPLVSEVLQGCLECVLMRDDTPAAVAYAEGQIRRLLSGRVELGELVMTGGLWRITGQQVAAAAAAEAEGGGNGGASASGGGGGPPPEDVRGPHASLAVRLSHRDPGRRFLLGERLGYVLLAGARTQDEAAEDPLAAAQRGAAPALELYWRNKLQPPLKELFAAVLPPVALQALLTGPHTMVRVDASLEAAPGGDSDAAGGAGGAAAATGMAGPASPRPNRGGGGGGGFGLAMTPRSPPSAKKGRGGGGSGGKGGVQSGLAAFYRQSARCLACRQALRHTAAVTSASASASPADAPGLCDACMREPDTLPATYLSQLSDDNAACVSLASALSACLTCHSGGHTGTVLCENGECEHTFSRLGAARRLAAAGERLARLDLCEPPPAAAAAAATAAAAVVQRERDEPTPGGGGRGGGRVAGRAAVGGGMPVRKLQW